MGSAEDVQTSAVASGGLLEVGVSDSSSSGNHTSAAMTELNRTASQAASDFRCKLAGTHVLFCGRDCGILWLTRGCSSLLHERLQCYNNSIWLPVCGRSQHS